MSTERPVVSPLQAVSNPFRGGVVGDPWNHGDEAADVSEIHHDVF